MSEKENAKKDEVVAKGDPGVVALLKKIQVKLDSLEEKIDNLARQSKGRSSGGRDSFAPRKDYGKPSYQKSGSYRGKKEETSSEGKFYHGQPFTKKKAAGKGSSRKLYKKTSK